MFFDVFGLEAARKKRQEKMLQFAAARELIARNKTAADTSAHERLAKGDYDESKIQISEQISFDGITVILFLYDGGIGGDNVYAINSDGNIVWHLNDILHAITPPGYSRIDKADDRTLKVCSSVDIFYKIDVFAKRVIYEENLRAPGTKIYYRDGYYLAEERGKYIISALDAYGKPTDHEMSKENFELALQSDEDAKNVIIFAETGKWPPTPEERRELTRQSLKRFPDLLVKIPKNQDYFTHDELVEIFEENHMDLKDIVK